MSGTQLIKKIIFPKDFASFSGDGDGGELSKP